MCKVGDIILIYNARANGTFVGGHPFLVLDDDGGNIKGLYNYDLIANLLSSAEPESKRIELEKHPDNFFVSKEDKTYIDESKNKDAMVRSNELYFFSKKKMKFKVIGKLEEEVLELLIQFINQRGLDGAKITYYTDLAEKI